MTRFLALCLLLIALTACGGSDDGAASTGNPPVDTGGNNDGSNDDGNTGEGTGDDSGNQRAGAYFDKTMSWQEDISEVALHPDSANIIAFLRDRNDSGTLFTISDGVMQVDFTSFHVLEAGAETRRLPYDETLVMQYGEWYGDPPCDNLIELPVPAGGRIEGVEGYECAETRGEDCHLIVHDKDASMLYELYHASVFDGATVGALCPAIWDLEYDYGDSLRGRNCTSADAAGLPIAPLLVTADEIAAGEIAHALRFILPNDAMRAGYHMPPATHSGGPSSTDQYAPIYGMRFRLRADYPVGDLGEAGQVIARALQTYGMIIVDGGRIPFTFQADALTKHKWSEFEDFGPRMFEDVLSPADFEIVGTGDAVVSTHDCELGVERSDRIRALLK